MRFTDIFIKRPVFSASLSLLILAMGLIAYQSLSLRQYPKLASNMIHISTSYTGASAATVESFVTTQIENAISGVDNIDYITSDSSAGKSKVDINLVLNADINAALEDINSNLSSVSKNLPEGVDDPVIMKVDPDSSPAIVVGFSSHARSPEQITDYLNRIIVPQLTTISGVGTADVIGDRTYAMRLWLNPGKMAALGITGSDIDDTLSDNNIQSQPGEIDREHQILSINAHTDLSTVEQFNNMVVKNVDGKLIRFRDIGRAELGAEAYDNSLLIEGKSGVGISISIKSSANPLLVSQQVKAVLSSVKEQMPEDMSMVYARDTSVYIENSVNEVVRTIVEAVVFVLIVIFCFIGSLRSVIIPLVTIPLSLVGAFALMFALGYSINTLTLLAFVLAIGMVVDDAIVVLENIHRHIEAGLSSTEAAIKGAREICFAVVAMTCTLAAVYAPIGFTSGFTSILFKEFAFTLAGTVVLSGFIALTLSPMMCAKLMQPVQQEVGLEAKINHFFQRLTHLYRRCLSQALRHRPVILVLLIMVIALGVVFFTPMAAQSTLAPSEDQGMIMGIGRAPTSASLSYTASYTKQLEPIYQSIPEADHYATVNGHPGGQNKAMTFLGLLPWGERDRSASDILQEVSQKASHIPGIFFMFFSPSSLPGSNSLYPVSLVIKTTGSYEVLNNSTKKMVQALEKNPGILRVNADLQLDKPELDITINRNKARTLGVTMSDINDAMRIALGEPSLGSFVREGETYNVITELESKYRNNPDLLNNINVATETGDMVPLSNLISIQSIVSPSTLSHFQQQRSTTLNLVLNANYSEEEAIQFFKAQAKTLLPDTMTYDFSGDTRQFIAAGSSMATIFFFSLLFIYLILSAQFESFIDPLIVLFTVPLSLVGALVTLYFAGGSLNIYTEIGLVTLVGLISKHGILIVEFANQLQATGMSIQAAVLEASTVRLRPILMTTAAMVLGACPLILASGAGAVSRAQMGWTIVGGMTFGTLLSLFVIPAMYTFLARSRVQ